MTPLFRTVVPLKRPPSPISHKSTIVSVGSCFAETMGSRLETNRFKCTVNPSGILFNPSSVAALLERLAQNRPYCADDLFLHQGLWKSRDHHSHFDNADRDAALGMMNDRLSRAAAFLDKLDVLMITFGTSAIYWHKEQKRVVANCHRMPNELFERRLLSAEEIVARYRDLFSKLLLKNPRLLIVLTVSPVRHLRDDPHENSVSKARLMAAAYELELLFPATIYYFPAYEIMMDELRDYRFYAADMAHPNEIAADYLWDRFCEACVAEESRAFIREFEPVVRSMQHRVKQEGSAAEAAFREELQLKIEDLRKRYPGVDVRVPVLSQPWLEYKEV
jgi:hypothetical protein